MEGKDVSKAFFMGNMMIRVTSGAEIETYRLVRDYLCKVREVVDVDYYVNPAAIIQSAIDLLGFHTYEAGDFSGDLCYDLFPIASVETWKNG